MSDDITKLINRLNNPFFDLNNDDFKDIAKPKQKTVKQGYANTRFDETKVNSVIDAINAKNDSKLQLATTLVRVLNKGFSDSSAALAALDDSNRKLFTDICSKMAMAMVTGGLKSEHFGFYVGGLSIELSKNENGKFDLLIEDVPDDDEVELEGIEPKSITKFVQQVEVECDQANFAKEVMNEMLDDIASIFTMPSSEDLKLLNAHVPSAKDAFSKFQNSAYQLIQTDYLSDKNVFDRDIYIKILNKALDTDEFTSEVLAKIDTQTIKQFVQNAIENRQNVDVDKIKAKITQFNNAPSLFVNSAEANHDMITITNMLSDATKRTKLNEIADITNIPARSDPQQNMTGMLQKEFHNFVADLFLPSDTTFRDSLDAQPAKLMQQVFLNHKDLIKNLIQNFYLITFIPETVMEGNQEKVQNKVVITENKTLKQLETLPKTVREHLEKPIQELVEALAKKYFNSLSETEKNQFFGSHSVDLDKLSKLIESYPLQELNTLDKSVRDVTAKLVAEQQKLINEKYDLSLSNPQVPSEENKAEKEEINLKSEFAKIQAKHVLSEEDNSLAVEKRNEILAQKQFVQNKEIILAALNKYKDLFITIFDAKQYKYEFDKNEHISDKNSNKAVSKKVQDYFNKHSEIELLFTPLNTIMKKVLGHSVFDVSWEGKIGEQLFNQFLTAIETSHQDPFDKEDEIEGLMQVCAKALLSKNEKTGDLSLDEEMKDIETSVVAKFVHKDFTSQSLAQMLNAPEDTNKIGMSLLIKNVLNSYFANLTGDKAKTENKDAREIDKRSMISSMIRYSDAKSSQADILGSMFKGTGPLMQRLLQDLNTQGMDKDLFEALLDMKSNLMPIDPTYVQAQMNKIIENSNGAISKIKIDKPLASTAVGQSFSVTYTDDEGEHRAVLKIIRPDAKQKALREFEMFKKEAEKIPGMLETFTGIYEQIVKEFDLTNEANNMDLGAKYYDYSFENRLDNVSLVPGTNATENSMLISVADGQTLESYMAECQDKINELKNTKFNNYEDLTKIREEAYKLFKQIYDVSKSMGLVATNWFDNALFPRNPENNENGEKHAFFHGDIHAGNLIVKPVETIAEDPVFGSYDYEEGSKITIIGYENASVLSEAQTEGVFKIKAACAFGGLYQFDANKDEQKIVEKKTKEMLISGFKMLLSPSELDKFNQKIEQEKLYENVIKPILFKGSTNEAPARLSLLMKKLQEAGVAIPGPISNMSKSENGIANAINGINSLLTQLRNMFKNDLYFKNTSQNDLVGYNFSIDKLEDIDTKSLAANFKLNISIAETNLNEKKKELEDAQKGENKVDKIVALKDEFNALNKNFKKAVHVQLGIMKAVDDCFKYSEDELWKEDNKSPEKMSKEEYTKFIDTNLKNYLKNKDQEPEFLKLHQDYLAARAKLSEDELNDLLKLESNIANQSDFVLDENLNKLYTFLDKNPNAKDFYSIQKDLTAKMGLRMIDNADKFKKMSSLKDPTLFDAYNTRYDLNQFAVNKVITAIVSKTGNETYENVKKLGLSDGFFEFGALNKYADFLNSKV